MKSLAAKHAKDANQVQKISFDDFLYVFAKKICSIKSFSLRSFACFAAKKVYLS